MAPYEHEGVDGIDGLIAQRDAILFGEWVPRPPRADGEACAVRRILSDGRSQVVAGRSRMFLELAFRALFPSDEVDNAIVYWNNSGRASRQDVLDVLDLAIRSMKEAADLHASGVGAP